MPSLPPGPTNFLAPIGLTFRHYFALRLNPIAYMTRLAKKYGDISFFRIFHHGAIFVNHPDLIREVLVKQASNFRKFDRIRNHLRQATGDGLLVTEGEQWHQQRVELQSVFKSDRMGEFFGVTEQYTKNRLAGWSESHSIEIEDEMTDLLQAIMGKSFFGIELDSGHQIAEAVRVYSDVFHHESRALFNWPDWFPTQFKKGKQQSIQILKESLGKIVRDRIQSGERKQDLLDMLLHSGCPHRLRHANEATVKSLAEESLSQLLTMYVAGFHTTSVALAWLFFCVAEYSDVQRKLHREIDRMHREDDLRGEIQAEGTYLDQVVKESLRLYPAAWELFARQNEQETELGGFRIPAGTLTLISPFVTQRDPKFFSSPDEFLPERFAPNAAERIDPFSYLPFGLGPHHCIGKSLALLQMKIILFQVLSQFEVSLARPSQSIDLVPRVSARPDGDIQLKLRRRNRSRSTSPQLQA